MDYLCIYDEITIIFDSEFRFYVGGKRRSYEQNQWIGINSAFYVYVYEQIYVVKYIYGSVTLLSHFAKCKNWKRKNQKCKKLFCLKLPNSSR